MLKGSSQWNCVRGYCLARKLCLPDLQDNIMDHFIAWLGRSNLWMGKSLLVEAYNSSEPGSGLRKFVTRTIAYRFRENVGIASAADMHELFVRMPGLCQEYLEFLKSTNFIAMKDPGLADQCLYHQHGIDRKCYKVAED